MITLKKAKKAGGETSNGETKTKKKISAALIRAQKDISDMHLPMTCVLEFSDPDDLLNFDLIIAPDEGIYNGGSFKFRFKITSQYPHEPPKVKCLTKVYHPNIDLEGNICLNILREDWKPVLNINSLIYGLQFLFLEPNADDPLNKEAAEVLRSNRKTFESNVSRAMSGNSINGISYDRCLKK